MKINWFVGDITDCTVDAIVNAANPTLLGGGGVDYAIHNAAGRSLKEACRAFPEIEPGIRCRVGRAMTTPGFDLMASFVIHTVGPIFPDGRDPHFAGEVKYASIPEAEEALASCIRNCLLEANSRHLLSIAFPAISCGNYGCSPITFGRVARKILEGKKWGLDLVEIVLFSQEELNLFEAGWAGEA